MCFGSKEEGYLAVLDPEWGAERVIDKEKSELILKYK